MVSKHITRDYSAHRKRTIRPSNEYVGLEIFSYDPAHTQYYLLETETLPKGKNAQKSTWRSWTCYKALSSSYDMSFTLDYLVTEKGEYRVDFLYEQNDNITTESGTLIIKNANDLTGEITITKDESLIYEDENVLFDGENNFIKRIPVFTELDEGKHQIMVDVPPNCLFYGVIVRKIIKYNCNNYYGADSGKDSGNMIFTNASLSISDMVKPSEFTATIMYDDAFECDESPSGFYIDYMDEVNFYVRNDDGDIVRAFGGYVSSILPNANRTELSLHCADRLVDGQNRYILDMIDIQGGKDEVKGKNFENYTHVLKYLCDVHETTLQSNISPNYLVEGEKYSKGFTITYGSDRTISKIPVTNGTATTSNNHVTLRNNSSGETKQVWRLYRAKDHSQQAPDITSFGYLHLTYGMGSPKTTEESKVTETVDNADSTAGVQSFGKCGVSQDKKYVMAIGQYSGAKGTSGYNYHTIYKTVFENKCPHCGGSLRWDSGRSDTNCIYCGGYNGSKRTWGNISETEISCTSCCADYDSVTGYEKDSPWKRLKKVGSTVKSSKAEQNKLHRGEMKAVPKTGVQLTNDDIFKAITNEAFKYKYSLGGGSQTYTSMKKTGKGDCWGFSDLIMSFMRKYGITAKVVQYATAYSGQHRSVLYKNEKNEWEDFPYREYGWNKKFNNMLNNTSGSKRGGAVDTNKGHNIGKVNVKSTKTTSKQTTKITTTKNYDKDKPFQGYLKITYSNNPSLDAPKKTLYLKFTQSHTSNESINEKGFPLAWVNNNTKRTTFRGHDDKPLNIVDWIRQTHLSNENVYLQSIHMIAPKKVVKKDSNEDANWYTYDKSTHDESSCKMDLYQITFNNNPEYNDAEDINSCGKTVNALMQDIVKDTGYLVNMSYGLHRKDDKINFRVNNTRETSFTASEGNNNNILSWNSISYSPVSSFHNMSIQVYKLDQDQTKSYLYIDSRHPASILRYGEQSTLQTSNEPISTSEAYFNARMNPNFNAEQTYTYTITVPNYPNLRLGEFVQVNANAKKLNTIKEVKSLKISFDSKKMPRVQTEIGLDELAPDLQLKENIRNLRKSAKADTTSFSNTAIPVQNYGYEWDR